MIVCHCFAVNDKTIKECIKNGANTISKIKKECLVGSDCGICLEYVRVLLKEQKKDKASSR